jgi:hypothetical protein
MQHQTIDTTILVSLFVAFYDNIRIVKDAIKSRPGRDCLIAECPGDNIINASRTGIFLSSGVTLANFHKGERMTPRPE